MLQIPLDIPDVQIETFDVTAKKGMVITVRSTFKGTTCRQCKKPIEKFYGYDKEITLRHLPIFEKPVWIKVRANTNHALYEETCSSFKPSITLPELT